VMSEGVALREVTSADIEIFFEQQLDPVASAMAAFPSRDLEAHRAHWSKVSARDDAINRTIVVEGEVAGNIVSWEDNGQREVGYWLGREFWGRGIASAALGLFLEVVTQRPLYAWVAGHNAASIRVLEKSGFTRATEQPPPDQDGTKMVVLELRD
jgi:RimJ/RimL family protein N-acetyltransferase